MNQSTKKGLSTTGLVLAALIWGSSFVVIKDTLNSIPPFALCVLRFTPAAILLALIYAPKLRHAKKEDMIKGCIVGIVMFTCYIADIMAFKYTTASKLAFITGLNVVFVPFLAWRVNKSRPDRYALIGVVLAATGLGLLTIHKGEAIGAGDLLALLSAILLAAHIVAIEHFGKDTDPVVFTIAQFVVTAVGFIVLTLLFESFTFKMVTASWPQMTYLSVFCTLIALLLQMVAQKYLTSTTTAMILTLSTIFGAAASIYFLHEFMSLPMLAGGVIILVAIVTQETKWSFLKGRLTVHDETGK